MHEWKFSVSWLNSITAVQIFFTIFIMKISFQSQFSHGPSLLLSPLLMQDRRNSIANALELHLACNNPWNYVYNSWFSVRLYDVNTFQCFVSGNPKDQHTGPITCVSGQAHFNSLMPRRHGSNLKIVITEHVTN